MSEPLGLWVTCPYCDVYAKVIEECEDYEENVWHNSCSHCGALLDNAFDWEELEEDL